METPKINITKAEVRDLDTGERVDDPEIAAVALNVMREAVERAGGTIEAPDNIVELFPSQNKD